MGNLLAGRPPGGRWPVLPLALLLAAPAAGQAVCGDFQAPVLHPTGDGARAVLLADLDGDGDLDAAVANELSDDVRILFGDGAAGFPTSATVAVGDGPYAIAAGFLDAFPGLDLAVANANAGTVSVIAGGTLLVIATVPAGTAPTSLAAADFDAAGGADLLVGLAGAPPFFGGGAVALLNDGTGTGFTALPLPPPAGLAFGSVAAVAAGDLDGDLVPEAVVADAGLLLPSVADNVFVARFVGGAFLPPVAVTAGASPAGLAIGDLDGDGLNDLLVADFGGLLEAGDVAVLRGTAGGPAPSFAPAIFQAAGLKPLAVALADLGDDSSPAGVDHDLAVVNFGSSDLTTLTTFAGGAFGGAASCAVGALPAGIAAGHLNSDLTADLVVPDFAGDGLAVLRAIPRPLAQPYGTACAGTLGLPVLDTVGLPAFGNGSFALRASNVLPGNFVFFAYALAPSSLPVSGGCTILLDLSFLVTAFGTLASPAGVALLPTPVPPYAAVLDGFRLYAQAAPIDPLGPAFGGITLTNALRLKLGTTP